MSHPPDLDFSPRARDAAQDLETALGLDERRGGLARVPRWLRFALLAAMLGGGGAYWLLGGTTTGPRYVTEPIVRGDLTVVVTATGSVQPRNKVDVSSELSGTVRRVLVDYNSPVTPGQVLAELDTDKLVATVENSRARLNAAQAQVAVAEATVVETAGVHERQRALVAKRLSTAQDLEAARAAHQRALAALRNARAQIGVAESDLRIDEVNLTKASIRSPIQGVVLARSVEPGQTVAASLQAPVLFTIAEDLTQMELQVDVDEADVGKTAVGQSATFTVDAYPARKFPARIRDVRFGSEIVQGVVTYKAVLTVDNTDLSLRPGMTTTAEIVTQKVLGTLLVSNAALRFSPGASPATGQKTSLLRRILPGRPLFRPPSKPDEGGHERTIWVLRGNEPTAVPVAIGATDGRRSEIASGDVEAGARAIVDMQASP